MNSTTVKLSSDDDENENNNENDNDLKYVVNHELEEKLIGSDSIDHQFSSSFNYSLAQEIPSGSSESIVNRRTEKRSIILTSTEPYREINSNNMNNSYLTMEQDEDKVSIIGSSSNTNSNSRPMVSSKNIIKKAKKSKRCKNISQNGIIIYNRG